MERSELELAEDPSTPAERLRQLAFRRDKTLCAVVATNPNVPTDLLWALAGAYPEEVFRNPSFELLPLEDPRWLDQIPPDAVFTLMSHPRAPDWFVDQTLSGPRGVLMRIAQRTQRSELLWRLVRKYSTDKELLEAVVNNPSTSVPLLEHLAAECDMVVPMLKRHQSPAPPYFVGAALASREGGMTPEQEAVLARHPKVSARQLERLAASPHELVRSAVASSPAASAALLVRLARDPSVRVREQVALNTACPRPLADKLERELPQPLQPFRLPS